MNAELKVISTENAPAAIGPYAQAIACGPFLFCSGQLPVNPKTGELAGLDIEAQTEQCWKNIQAVVERSGSKLNRIVKTTVFMKNLGDFGRMNTVYERMLEGHKPARSTVEVSRLPKDCLVEIECVVAL